MNMQTKKDIDQRLAKISKLKGEALRKAYVEIVGREPKETNRTALVREIARVLYHSAEVAAKKSETKSKATPKKVKPAKKTAPAPDDSQLELAAGGAAASSATAKANGGPADAAVNPVVAADAASAGTAVDAEGGTASVDVARPADESTAVGAPAADGAPAAVPVVDTGAANGAPKRRTVRSAGVRDPRLPPAGHVLKREYKGQTIEATLLQDNGCLVEGKKYQSLSGFVKALTGTNHNGLLWFGLAKRPSKADGDLVASPDTKSENHVEMAAPRAADE